MLLYARLTSQHQCRDFNFRIVQWLPLRRQFLRKLSTTRGSPAGPYKTASPVGAVPKAPAPKPFVRSTPPEALKNLPPPKPFAGTKGRAPAPPQPGQAFPVQLVIYHAGKPLTLFVASFKLGALFIFVFCSLLVAPQYYYSTYESTWMVPVVILVGSIPLIVMVLTTYPFVTYVHLALPQFARLSRERLERYISNLPPTATLDITSLRWVWPRVTRLQVSELSMLSSRASGAMTLRRNVPDAVWDSRRWYDYRPEKGFMVAGRSGKVPEKTIWPRLMAMVRTGMFESSSRTPSLARADLSRSPHAPTPQKQ